MNIKTILGLVVLSLFIFQSAAMAYRPQQHREVQKRQEAISEKKTAYINEDPQSWLNDVIVNPIRGLFGESEEQAEPGE